jgi:glycosyltransferase involved in cell wall biosynthesis
VDLRWFKFAPERSAEAGVRILFLGSVAREGGLHTAVLALRDVPENAVLRVAGPVKDKEYLAEVAELGRAGDVMQRIEFSAPVSRTDLPALLRSAHVLVVGDAEPEAFPRTLLQAFAVGTPVVGTAIGPSAEALIEGKTGLVFDVGNSHALARQLGRMLQEPELRAEVTRTARKLVERRYAIGYTTTQIERILQRAAAR